MQALFRQRFIEAGDPGRYTLCLYHSGELMASLFDKTLIQNMELKNRLVRSATHKGNI
jgi:membrane-anchored protein YejM (alkaline phosphatase superfamily)